MKTQVTSRYRCKNNHEYVSNNGDPFRFKVETVGGHIFTGPVCPICYVNWLSTAFPTIEISRIETQIEDKDSGVSN